MRTRASISRFCIPAAFTALLAGCTYSADVRNTTNEPVFVQMLQIDPVQPDWVLDSARIAPGQYAKLGPKRVPFQRVVIDVGNQTHNSVNGRTTITPGGSRLDVGMTTDPTRDEITFTLKTRD